MEECHLLVHYTTTTEPAVETISPLVDVVSSSLTELGLLKNIHGDHGHYTWYKLAEWMQVEILQIFGQSLEHTPW